MAEKRKAGEEKLGFSMEEYNSMRERIKDNMKDKKASEIRPALYKWIGATLNQLEVSSNMRDCKTILEVALEALATLEAYMQTMEERARTYRSSQRARSNYRVSSRSRRW